MPRPSPWRLSMRQCLGLAVLYTLSSSGQPERLDTNTIMSVTYQSLLTVKSTLSITKFVIPAIYQEWYQPLTYGLLVALHPTCDKMLYSNPHFLLHYAISSSRALCSNQLESLRSQPYFSTRTSCNRIAFLGLVSMSFIMDIVHSDSAKNSKFSGPFVFLSLPGEIRNQIYTLYFKQEIYDWNLGLAKYNDDFEDKLPIYFEILLVSRRIYPPAATTTTAIRFPSA